MPERKNAGLKNESSAGSSQLLLLGANASQLALGLLITVILARFLEPEDFGFFALLSAIFVVGRELIDMGTGSIAVREIVRNPADEVRVLSTLLGWRRLVAIGLGVLCAGLALKAETSHQAIVLVLAGLVMGLLYHNAFYVVFQVRQAFIFPASLAISMQFIMLGLCITVILTKAAGILVALFVLARECAMTFGTRLLAVRFLPRMPRPGLRGEHFQDLYRKVLIFGLANFFYHLAVHGGTFFIWFLGTTLEVGAYSAVFRLIYPLMTLPWVMMIPVLPVFSNLAMDDFDAFAMQIGANFRLLLGIGLNIAVAGFVLAPSALRLLYGEKFITGPVDAVDTFQWLSLAFLLANIAPALAIGLLAAGRERVLLGIAGGTLAVNVVCNLLLIPAIGFTGTAVSLVIAEFALVLSLLVVVSNTIGVNHLVKHMLYFCMPSIGLFVALLLLPETLFVRLVGGVLLTSLALIIVWTLPSARHMRKELALIGQDHGVSND